MIKKRKSRENGKETRREGGRNLIYFSQEGRKVTDQAGEKY